MPERLKLLRIDTRAADVRQAIADLRERLSPRGNVVSEAGRQRTIEVFGEPLSPQQVVERICNEVRKNGLPAVLDYSTRIDKAAVTAETLRVPAAELSAAHAAADPEFLASICRIRENILRFQTAILQHDVEVELLEPSPPGRGQGEGAGNADRTLNQAKQPRDTLTPALSQRERENFGYLKQRYLPLARVGICVPGGAAAYPSTVLMTAVPAQAAGVKELAIVAPPTKFGAYNPDLLATCHELGITEVYRMGGAQAVAALAYGVEGVPKVDKIVGPGNLFVALAKRHVFGEVDIDSIAGPSEVVVIADETARANFIASDLIAQAEHAPGSGILITWSEDLFAAVAAEIEKQTAHLSRGDLARQSLEQFGALILARNSEEACDLANEIASEHLHISTANAAALADKIPHAGAIFLGHYSPVATGDYAAGPSHVLPTAGTARFAAGLTANDFLRGNSIIALTEAGLKHLAPDIRRLADKEGLTAHRASIDIRLP